MVKHNVEKLMETNRKDCVGCHGCVAICSDACDIYGA